MSSDFSQQFYIGLQCLSDIAVFVLKRDIKLKPTNLCYSGLFICTAVNLAKHSA